MNSLWLEKPKISYSNSIIFLDDNEIFLRYVKAVSLSARATVIVLNNSQKLREVLRSHKPRTAIIDLHMPDRDAIELLPVLKAAGSVTHLVIVSGTRSPILNAAGRLAQEAHSWTVETWAKPIRTDFLRNRLEQFSGAVGR
jgi:DNA-binding NtrC family response regulator